MSVNRVSVKWVTFDPVSRIDVAAFAAVTARMTTGLAAQGYALFLDERVEIEPAKVAATVERRLARGQELVLSLDRSWSATFPRLTEFFWLTVHRFPEFGESILRVDVMGSTVDEVLPIEIGALTEMIVDLHDASRAAFGLIGLGERDVSFSERRPNDVRARRSSWETKGPGVAWGTWVAERELEILGGRQVVESEAPVAQVVSRPHGVMLLLTDDFREPTMGERMRLERFLDPVLVPQF